jgi:hypothetical protein
MLQKEVVKEEEAAPARKRKQDPAERVGSMFITASQKKPPRLEEAFLFSVQRKHQDHKSQRKETLVEEERFSKQADQQEHKAVRVLFKSFLLYSLD